MILAKIEFVAWMWEGRESHADVKAPAQVKSALAHLILQYLDAYESYAEDETAFTPFSRSRDYSSLGKPLYKTVIHQRYNIVVGL